MLLPLLSKHPSSSSSTARVGLWLQRCWASGVDSTAYSWLPDGGKFSLLAEPEAGGLPYPARLKAFEAWLTAAGAKHSLELRGSGAGRGVAGFAVNQVARGAAVIELPMECLIKAPVAQATALGDIGDASGVDDNDGNLFLVLALLEGWARQRECAIAREGPASGGPRLEPLLLPSRPPFHAPYLDIIPRRLPHMPLFWSDGELQALLAGSPLLDAVEERRSAIVDDFRELRAEAQRRRDGRYRRRLRRSMSLPLGQPATDGALLGKASAAAGSVGVKEEEKEQQQQHGGWLRASEVSRAAEEAESLLLDGHISAADFAVAEMNVASRAFLVVGGGRGGRSAHCMVPLADMLNTALPHTCDVDFTTARSAPSQRRTEARRPNGSIEEEEEGGGGGGGGSGGGGGDVFRMTALQDIEAGQEVHDSYGYKSNDRYLLNYGFSLEQNVTFNGECPNELPIYLRLDGLDSTAADAGESDKKAGGGKSSNKLLAAHKALLWPGGDASAAVKIVVTAPPSAAMSRNGALDDNGGGGGGEASAVEIDGRTAQLVSLLRFIVADEDDFRGLCSTHLAGVVRWRERPEARTTLGRGNDNVSSGRPLPGGERMPQQRGEGGGAREEETADLRAAEAALLPLELLEGRFPLPKLATLPYLSHANEAATWAALEALCRRMLGAYPTALPEDEAAVARAGSCEARDAAAAAPAGRSGGGGGGVQGVGEERRLVKFSNAWNARVHVRGEKRIISHLVAAAVDMQKQLRQGKKK